MTDEVEDEHSRWLVTHNDKEGKFLLCLENVEGISYCPPRRYDVTGSSLKFSWKWPFISKIKTITEHTERGYIILYVSGNAHRYDYTYENIKDYKNCLEIIREVMKIENL